MNLLIPYKYLVGHNDPCFEEYTYGDVKSRGKKLKTLQKGDYLFFHTGYGGRRYITAYYVVERALDVSEVVKDRNLCAKYSNPHIKEYKSGRGRKQINNVLLFGDPISSKILKRPLLFDRKLAEKLSLKIFFPPGRTETQAITSATRSWRPLTDKNLDTLFDAIKKLENTVVSNNTILSTEEVTDVLERDIEQLIQKNPHLIDVDKVTIIDRQVDVQTGRIDLLFKRRGSLIVVELKLGKVGHSAVNQIQKYIKTVKDTQKNGKVSGIIVCQGVMPTFQRELQKLRDVRIFCYGWQLKLYPWVLDKSI